MHNVLQVFSRDLKRILRAPKVWAIVIGLLIMPSLYAWVNIIAFWDPYSNTRDLKVAVVNLDEGGDSSMTGPLNVGDQVVAQLKENHDLGWQFLGEEEAMDAVKSGSSYAAIVVPPEFTSDLLSIATGDFIRPELQYYVNEKANAISPKITGVGASTLDTMINSTFVSTVAQTVAQDLEQAGIDVGNQLVSAQDRTLSALDEAVGDVESAREGLADIQESLGFAQTALEDTRRALNDVDGTITEVQRAVAESQDLIGEVQQELGTFTDSVTTAYVSGAALLSDAASRLNGVIAQVTTGAQQANVAVGSAITDVTAVIDANGRALDRLQDLLSTIGTEAPEVPADPEDPEAPVDPGTPEEPVAPENPGLEAARAALEAAVAQLQERNAADQQLLAELQTLNTDVSAVVSGIQGAADAINAAVRDSADSASSIRVVLMDTIPDINRAMSAVSASAGAFSSALEAQQVLVRQTTELLTGLEGQLTETGEALSALDGNLADAQQGLEDVRTDVMALGAATIWNQVSALTDLNPEQIAEFMASPVQVNQHTLFPVATYGSAMAPLFTNLSLWIGAFMLVVLLRQEVDTEGVEGLTVRQAYMGRFTLLAMFHVVQALIVSIGNAVIGVQMVSPVAFVATSVFVGLVFLSIIYALAVSFGYVGKGLAILLVIMQIPGASGIYPIQMMPEFFRALFPFFPFTYGINAMREVIGGFYDGYYWRAVGVLLIFAALAFALGILFRQRLGNFARLFNRKLADTGLFVPEDVQILGSRRRLAQIMSALTDRARFRQRTARQAGWFSAHYKTFVLTTVAIGVGLTIVLGVVSHFVPDAKATILGLWGVLCVLVIATLVMFEYIKQNNAFASQIGDMSTSDLQRELVREEAATRTDAELDQIKEQVSRT